MNNRPITVIKRKDVSERARIVLTEKTVADPQLEIADRINEWIDKATVNDRKAKAFSEEKILSWKILPEAT